MIILITILIVAVAMIIFTGFFLITSGKINISYEKTPSIKISEKLLRIIERADISLEKFLLYNFIIILILVITVVNTVFISKNITIQSLALPYFLLTGFYLNLIVKNNRFRSEAKRDIEEIMRISYFLEKGGSEEKEVYRHLSTVIKGPLNHHMRSMFSSYKIIKDQKSILEEIKTDFSDIQEVITFANIAIQKLDTGKSERILRNQLQAIKKIKHENFKVKRHRSRLKLYLMSFLLAASYMSVAVYPLIKDTLNNISKILY